MRALLAQRRADGGGPADPAVESATPPEVRGARQLRVATVAAAVLAGLGLIGAVVFGTLWWGTTHGDAARTAAAREAALADARQISVNLMTLDSQTVDQGLDTWEASATGPLLEEFKKGRQGYADQVRAARSATSAQVSDAALSDLDVAGGKATAVIVANVNRTVGGRPVPGAEAPQSVRVQLNLVRTPAGWKAEAISIV